MKVNHIVEVYRNNISSKLAGYPFCQMSISKVKMMKSQRRLHLSQNYQNLHHCAMICVLKIGY